MTIFNTKAIYISGQRGIIICRDKFRYSSWQKNFLP